MNKFGLNRFLELIAPVVGRNGDLKIRMVVVRAILALVKLLSSLWCLTKSNILGWASTLRPPRVRLASDTQLNYSWPPTDAWLPSAEGTKEPIEYHSLVFWIIHWMSFFFYRKGQAIWIDENIRYGKTDGCLTFNNPPLASTTDFEIRVLEVYGFQNV